MKVCLFDIDGTLVLTGGAGQYAFADSFREVFGIEKINRNVSFAGRSDRGIAGDLFEHHGIENSQTNWEQFQSVYLGHLENQLVKQEGTLLPGVEKLIDQLEAMGDVHIGLLTGNVVAAAERKLEYYGIWDRFAFGGFGDKHPQRNDIASAAREAARTHHRSISPAASPAEASEADQEKIMVIGDTPNDITCARSIGALAVGVPTGHTSSEELEAESPDLLLPNLESGDAILDWFVA